jgi:type IV secretion system protein VirB3
VEERLLNDTLFLALTRPTLWLGVPIEASILIAMLAVLILMLLGNPLYSLAVGGGLLSAARLVVRTDYNMFKLLFLWARTKGRALNKAYWGGSSYSPLPVAGVARKGFARG